jgi:hypothetical protein
MEQTSSSLLVKHLYQNQVAKLAILHYSSTLRILLSDQDKNLGIMERQKSLKHKGAYFVPFELC